MKNFCLSSGKEPSKLRAKEGVLAAGQIFGNVKRAVAHAVVGCAIDPGIGQRQRLLGSRISK